MRESILIYLSTVVTFLNKFNSKAKHLIKIENNKKINTLIVCVFFSADLE